MRSLALALVDMHLCLTSSSFVAPLASINWIFMVCYRPQERERERQSITRREKWKYGNSAPPRLLRFQGEPHQARLIRLRKPPPANLGALSVFIRDWLYTYFRSALLAAARMISKNNGLPHLIRHSLLLARASTCKLCGMWTMFSLSLPFSLSL